MENSADMVHEGFSNAVRDSQPMPTKERDLCPFLTPRWNRFLQYACVSAPLSEIIMELTHSSPPGTPFTIHATGHSLGASLPCRTPRWDAYASSAFCVFRSTSHSL